MPSGLVRLFAVTVTVIGSLALAGMAMADCTPSHVKTTSTSAPDSTTTTGTASGG
jgi:hypothetical protein